MGSGDCLVHYRNLFGSRRGHLLVSENSSQIKMKRKSIVPSILVFAFHTLTVYICALFLAPWLVARWFLWIVPVLQIRTNIPPGDWYLQHFELINIILALILGYISAKQHHPFVTLAWLVPTVALMYKLIQYQHVSVLSGSSVEALTYFFEIPQAMPSHTNPSVSDPVRVLAQMTITAPFYSGLGYSLGGLVSRLKVLTSSGKGMHN
jgi:hypothetical protein